MSEIKLWKPDLPEITLKDIYQAEGADYSKRSPRPKIVELHQRIMAEAIELINPTAIMREVNIVGKDERYLYLEDGYKLTSKLLAKVAGTAEKLVLLTMTIGNSLEEQISAYTQAGKTMEAFILDAIGTTLVAKGSMAVLNTMEESYKQAGMKTTFPMGPGHSYWSEMEDVKIIFHFLEAEKAGLSLLDSSLIMPRKSIAFVMGIGSELPAHHDKTHCDFCSIKNRCHMRQSS